MDTITLTGTTLRGSVDGRTINCSVKSSPAGLRLPPGQYILKAAPNNPVYGPAVSIEGGAPAAGQASAVAALVAPGAPVSHYYKTPQGAGSPGAIKFGPAGIKDAPTGKVDAPAGKFFEPPAGKFFDAPASPRDAAGGRPAQRVLIGSRAVGENCFVALAGFSDLLDAVQRAGAVALIVT
jgi:hypothetical protein